MKFRVLFLLSILSFVSLNINAQRGMRIGYVDTEYILQNVPEYKEASTQLDKKVLQWKTEIEKKLAVIDQKKKELENESVLLTKELYEERLEDITFEEAQIIEYQQNRFGPSGDLMIQKRQLIEPIQDQIFAAVQDIAEAGKYDMVFDKSANDVIMLYSADRFDLSERVLKTITRSSKRSQVKSKKERKELEQEEVVPVVSNELDARKKALEEKKAAREKTLAAKRAEREAALEAQRVKREEAREAKRKEAEARRQKAIDARNGKVTEANTNESEENTKIKDTSATGKKIIKTDSTKVKAVIKTDTTKTALKKTKTAAEILEEKRLKKLKDREARAKALQAKKQKIIDDRKKARDERAKQIKKNDSIAKAKKEGKNN